MLDDKVGINFDIKKIYLETTATVDYGNVAKADVNIDPLLIGIGATYKF